MEIFSPNNSYAAQVADSDGSPSLSVSGKQLIGPEITLVNLI
ncbi:hypothetical protein [Nostoc flagelliforme]|nr:hypothetical protein [Nostoc flagelliforme]